MFEFPSLVSCMCRFLFVDTHIYLGWGGTDLNLPRLCQLNLCKARLQVVPLFTKNWRASLGNLQLILQGCPRNLTWSFNYISSTHRELFICFAWCGDHSRFEIMQNWNTWSEERSRHASTSNITRKALEELEFGGCIYQKKVVNSVIWKCHVSKLPALVDQMDRISNSFHLPASKKNYVTQALCDWNIPKH